MVNYRVTPAFWWVFSTEEPENAISVAEIWMQAQWITFCTNIEMTSGLRSATDSVNAGLAQFLV